MDIETASLRSFHDLDSLYLDLLSDVKSGGPIWDDIISKSGKLFAALRTTVHASDAFLDAIQRLADLASKTSGGSKEIGAHFTRLCMRQKRLGSKVKTMGNQLITCMVNPMIGRLDEWKKSIAQIEKEHNRETKRARGEFKRALSEANRLKRKLAKQGNSGTLHSRQNSGSGTIGQGVGLGEPPTSNRIPSPNISGGIGNSTLAVRTESAIKILEEKVRRMEDLERATIKRLMLEERERYCFFFNCLRPVLETETSLLGEISTLRELFTALSTATEDPSRLLEEAESVLARAGAVTGEAGAPVTPSGSLHSPNTNKMETFASVVDAIMSSQQQRQQQQQQQQEATPSLASDSIGSTSSGWSSNGVAGGIVGEGGPCSSPISSHSAGSGPIGDPQHQIAAILRQSQNDVGPRSASVGRQVVNGTPLRVISTSGVEEVVLRRPTNNAICVTSTPSRRPQTTTTETHEFSGLPSVSAVTPVQPSPDQRHSTCTLQQLNDAVMPACSPGFEETTLKNSTNNEHQEEEEEEEEETASGTLDEETSDDGVLSEDRRLSNGDGRNTIGGSGELRRPALTSLLSREHRSLSRGGELHKLLYPDQSLPPPVYTNLNRLTHAAQRKFSMSTTVSPNTPTAGPAGDPMTWHQPVIGEGDNLSIASAPHGQPETASTNGGVYSMPGSPHRPSFSTLSTNSRPRGSSLGVEDPFSVEMDELDRMVTGSSAASSLTSRSGRSGTDSTSQQPPTRPINNSTGIPVGLLRASQSPDINVLRRSRSRSSSFCSSLAKKTVPADLEPGGVPMIPSDTQYIPNLEQLNRWVPQPVAVQHAVSAAVDVEKRANQVSSTAASLLTQLSGQLQQLTSSSVASTQKQQARPSSGNESAEFDLPAPPSPDMLDVR